MAAPERWVHTLKEQCLWAELHDTVDQLRQAVARFVATYNTQWLIAGSATAPQRRPTRPPSRPRRHDQIDVRSVQPSGRSSARNRPCPYSATEAVIGTLEIEDPATDAFDEKDQAFFEDLADAITGFYG